MGSVSLSPLVVTVILLWISSPSFAQPAKENMANFLESVQNNFAETDALPAKPEGKTSAKRNSGKGKGSSSPSDNSDGAPPDAPWTFKGPVTPIVKDAIRKPIKGRKYPMVPLIYLKGQKVQPTIVVDCKAKADFKTINAAIQYLIKNPSPTNQRAVIFLRSCVYSEKVLIPSAAGKVTLKGEDVYGVTISWGDTAGTVAKNDSGIVAPLKTYGSYTLAAMSDYFVMEDITVINTAPQPDPTAFPAIGMAVAYRVTANFTAHYHCRYLSWQDTLYDHRGVHYYYGCYIQGSVDFVFGNGQTIYENCTFYAMNVGSITAQKRFLPKQKTGFVILRSQVLGYAISNLGRPWGNFSRVVYLYSYLDGIRSDQYGWAQWAPGFEFRLKQAFYGEYQCYGPSAVNTPRNNWTYILTDSQAAPFLKYTFITGGKYNGPWLPGPPGKSYNLLPFNAPMRPPSPPPIFGVITSNPNVLSPDIAPSGTTVPSNPANISPSSPGGTTPPSVPPTLPDPTVSVSVNKGSPAPSAVPPPAVPITNAQPAPSPTATNNDSVSVNLPARSFAPQGSAGSPPTATSTPPPTADPTTPSPIPSVTKRLGTAATSSAPGPA